MVGSANATQTGRAGSLFFIHGLCQEGQALLEHSIRDLPVSARPALQRVLGVLTEDTCHERFEYGVAKLLKS
jgi:hypothetical protein